MKSRILIVEDEVIVAEDLRQGLQRLGYEVIGCASSGDDALGHIASMPPDLVLMDVQLNGPKDGVQTSKEIRTIIDLPVVYLTAHSDVHTLSRAAETEPFGFLLKPFQERELFTTIEVALYKHRADRQLRESEDRYRRLTQALTDYTYTVLVEHGKAVETMHGPACVAVTGYTQAEFRSDPHLWTSLVDEADRPAVERQTCEVLDGKIPQPIEHRILRKDGKRRWVCNTPVPRTDAKGAVISYDALIQDISARKQVEEERERLVRELQEALASVKTLRGMLPICSSCKKIRDDAGYWTQVESYIMLHTDAHFSHGLCPECAKRLYPGIFGKQEG